MKIQLKVLNKKFYKEESNGMLLNPLPEYETPGSAGLDLRCTEDVTIYPGEVVDIYTGIAIWIGSNTESTSISEFNNIGFAGLIIPRSGLGSKGLILANTVGLLDEDYQGELLIKAWNRLLEPPKYIYYEDPNVIKLKAGDRIAQLVLMPVIKSEFEVVNEFSQQTQRGTDGFGSTNNS